MNNIIIGRLENDDQAQGVVRPQDGSWQLVIDKEGYPHLYVRVKDEDGLVGMFCVEDMFIGKDGDDTITIKDLMTSTFGGKLSPEEEAKAIEEYNTSREKTGIPCPRPT